MPLPLPETIFDAERMSRARAEMPTDLSTAELRDLGADVLARSVFTARGTSAIFTSRIKEVVDELAAGNLSEGQARTALWECLKAIGYTPEGGFPQASSATTPGQAGDEGKVPPALKGTLQDLSSFRRLDLIVRTQAELMQGAGAQWRGHQPEMLKAYPAWELVRKDPKTAPRNWSGDAPSKKDPRPRWIIAGGELKEGRMIALKGDPIWGELGSYDNFPDALGVDHPPFAFNSGMGWRAVPDSEVQRLGIVGPDGETPADWFATEPVTMAGKIPKLPTPQVSLKGVDPALIERFRRTTRATPVQGKADTLSYSDLFARDIARMNAKNAGGAS